MSIHYIWVVLTKYIATSGDLVGARGAIAPLLATLRNAKTQYIDIKMHQDIVIPALSVIFTLYKT